MSQIDTTSGAELWLRGMGLGHSIRQAEQQQDFDRQRFAWQQEEAALDNAFRQQVQDSSNAHWDSEMLRRLFGDAEHSRQFDLNYGLQSDVQQRLQQEFEDRQAAETSAGEAMRAQNRMMLGRFGGSSDPSMLVPDQPGSLGPGLKDIADLVERGHPKAQPVIAKILQSEVGSRRLAGALAEAKAGGVSPGALADPDLRDLVQHSLDINDPEAGFKMMQQAALENIRNKGRIELARAKSEPPTAEVMQQDISDQLQLHPDWSSERAEAYLRQRMRKQVGVLPPATSAAEVRATAQREKLAIDQQKARVSRYEKAYKELAGGHLKPPTSDERELAAREQPEYSWFSTDDTDTKNWQDAKEKVRAWSLYQSAQGELDAAYETAKTPGGAASRTAPATPAAPSPPADPQAGKTPADVYAAWEKTLGGKKPTREQVAEIATQLKSMGLDRNSIEQVLRGVK